MMRNYFLFILLMISMSAAAEVTGTPDETQVHGLAAATGGGRPPAEADPLKETEDKFNHADQLTLHGVPTGDTMYFGKCYGVSYGMHADYSDGHSNDYPPHDLSDFADSGVPYTLCLHSAADGANLAILNGKKFSCPHTGEIRSVSLKIAGNNDLGETYDRTQKGLQGSDWSTMNHFYGWDILRRKDDSWYFGESKAKVSTMQAPPGSLTSTDTDHSKAFCTFSTTPEFQLPHQSNDGTYTIKSPVITNLNARWVTLRDPATGRSFTAALGSDWANLSRTFYRGGAVTMSGTVDSSNTRQYNGLMTAKTANQKVNVTLSDTNPITVVNVEFP